MAVFSMAGSNPALPTYPLQRSVRLRSSASAYFNRTLTTPTSNTTWTYSLWVKRGALSTNQALISAGTSEIGYSVTTDTIKFYSSGPTLVATSTPVYRDPSAWGHLVFVSNGTTVVAYYNNVSILSYTGTLPQLNSAIAHNIGKYAGGSSDYFDGYLTEVNFIDGQALTPSSFGAYNSYGVWSPAKYTGTYNTNGFYLNFQDNSALTTTANVGIGKDSSGNGNYWTSNNISITAGVTYDSMLDVPTLTSTTNANFAVMNPIVPTGASVISGGNLNIVGVATYCNGLSTINLDSGSYYAECVVNTHVAEGWGVWDITKSAAANTGTTPSGFYGIYSGGATLMSNGTNVTTNAAGTPANGDILQVAWNNGKVWLGKNNTWYDSSFGTTGNPSAGTNATFTGLTVSQFAFIFGIGNGATSLSANFGQRPFSYTPPTGYNRLCTYNLPDSIVPVGAQYMAATKYTGTGASLAVTNTVNGFSFQPDFVWIKDRTSALNHRLLDSVRGTTSLLYSNTTDAQVTIPNANDSFSSFNSSGFTLGVGQGMNASGDAYVGWQWRASNASAVTNTAGSISSQVSANQTAGFSIVTFTCPASGNFTVGHGLGVVPSMFILKTINGVDGWYVYHKNLATPASNYLVLNTTAATATSTSIWGNTNPTSSVLTLGTNAGIGANLNGLLYCFAAVPGYSAFGSYTGNGSADGPFVFTNFRPRYILIKRTDTAGASWNIRDTSRNTFNTATAGLFANLSNAESTQAAIDILSNGFKCRDAGGSETNASGGTYIYACFAENPFKNSLAR